MFPIGYEIGISRIQTRRTDLARGKVRLQPLFISSSYSVSFSVTSLSRILLYGFDGPDARIATLYLAAGSIDTIPSSSRLSLSNLICFPIIFHSPDSTPPRPPPLSSFLNSLLYPFFLPQVMTRGSFIFVLLGLSSVTSLRVDLLNFPY